MPRWFPRRPVTSSPPRQTRPRYVRIGGSATVLALLLSSVIAYDAVALTWGLVRTLTTLRNANADHGLAATSGSTFHALYKEARGGIAVIRHRKSTDGGTTWSASTVLSSANATYVYGAAIVGRGSTLDAAWVEYYGNGTTALVYRRSSNAGATWSSPIALAGTIPAATAAAPTPAEAGDVLVVELVAVETATFEVDAADDAAKPGARAADVPLRPARAAGGRALAAAAASPSYPRLARDSANRVILAWTDDLSGAVFVRRSTDGGGTWSAALTLDTTTNDPTEGYLDAYPDVAVGTDAAYIVYYKTPTSLRVRRSTNGGATWTTYTTLATNGSGFVPSVVAAGSSAVVGYAVWSGGYLYTVTRRTADKGATWKAVVKLGSSTGFPTFQPKLIRGASRWHAVFERCLDSACNTSGSYYRSSADGTTWTTSVRISSSARPYEYPAGFAYADRVGVVFGDVNTVLLDRDLFFRAGS